MFQSSGQLGDVNMLHFFLHSIITFRVQLAVCEVSCVGG